MKLLALVCLAWALFVAHAFYSASQRPAAANPLCLPPSAKPRPKQPIEPVYRMGEDQRTVA